MNKFLSVPLAALLLVPSCATVQAARDKLAQMSQADYEALQIKTLDAGKKAGDKLKELLADKLELLGDVDMLAATLAAAVQNDALDTADLARYLVERLGTKLEPKYREYLNDGVKLLDAAVGQISLGIDGKFTEREKGLAVALLFGIHQGLSAQ